MCGGTLARHVQAGDDVMVLALSDGCCRGDDPAKRWAMFDAAMTVLGIAQTVRGNWPDQQFDTVPLLHIIRDIEQCVRGFEPGVVYTHWRGDLNIDHQITSEAVQVACRPLPGCSVRTLLFGECSSSTEWGHGFEPTYWVDVTGLTRTKDDAMECYESEIRYWPHPRSLHAISMHSNYRGPTIGVDHAEAFMVGRICV